MYGVATNSPTPAAGPFVSPKKTSPISSGRSRRSPGRTSRTPPKSGAEDFPLSHFQERIDDIVDRLEHGLGLVLLRGLPIYDRFSEDEAAIIYWGMGRHMGNLVPQNRKGDLVGDIKDLGRRGPYERAYATNEDLGFHTDSTDFVALMCPDSPRC